MSLRRIIYTYNLPDIYCRDEEIYAIGNKIQTAFWDFNDNVAAKYGFCKFRNLYNFMKFYYSANDDDSIKNFINKFKHIQSIQLVAGVILISNRLDKVLLVKNKKSKCWSFPKGKVHAGEPPEECAIRECLEETGYSLQKDKIKSFSIQRKFNKRPGVFYFIKNVPENYEFVAENEHEISDIQWHSIDDRLKTRDYNIFINKIYPELVKYVSDE